MKNLEYPDRLKELKLPTLTYKRIRGDMITVYKILNGLCQSECCPKLESLCEKTGKRGRHSKALYQNRSNTDLRKFSFTQRVVAG